ncbi:hypothetical protein [Paraburkholderia phenoliruptrix]|uniref:hypothetical protein n=1 Tax=Paraburkholderia phenoliruptrix TaxID=252970 RepID=UPI002869E40E|nr:hypothetical protein [Paraburkholderia phenoliruptrix]WMY08762.1 hypothetical protein P3F88_03000 [Paraburkholderia phenoliruptrix]
MRLVGGAGRQVVLRDKRKALAAAGELARLPGIDIHFGEQGGVAFERRTLPALAARGELGEPRP